MSHSSQRHESLVRSTKLKTPAKNGPFPLYEKLPLEVRQQILYYALEWPSPASSPNLNWLTQQTGYRSNAALLSEVHPIIGEEVQFPLKVRERESQTFWEGQVKTIEELGREVNEYLKSWATCKEGGEAKEHEILLAANKELAAKVQPCVVTLGSLYSYPFEQRFQILMIMFERQIWGGRRQYPLKHKGFRSAVNIATKLGNEFEVGLAGVESAWTKWAEVFHLYIKQVEEGIPGSDQYTSWEEWGHSRAIIQSYIKDKHLL
ncbi:hypothetical protein EG327_007073 [Venturia inaequalis]|uniref:Uncharacterized protein n=1 Tax=Venturia inaequalis TaxID=5025 RepID=A0A8H3Z3G2_VENIN|nr:hypothetical protein EG327_007073 [Venturia inaequalis]